MSNIAIIAEYNPFHNGHKFLIDTARERTGLDTVIALMSGNFVQRGVPAMADKYTRAEAALAGGASMVFELPVLFATGSARDFAFGAINILDKMNSVEYLVFGAEDERMDIFDRVSDILAFEPEEYTTLLNDFLSKGLSYPAASEKALVKILGDDKSPVLSKPNNILAMSYLTAIKRFKSQIKPIIIKRNDPGYHSTELNQAFSSATAIRKAMEENQDIKDFVPHKCMEIYNHYLDKELPDGQWLTPFIASRLIYDRNLDPKISALAMTLDMNQELLNRIRKAPLPAKYVELLDYMKTRNITQTRVSRVLLHMVLGITNGDRELAYNNGFSDYINLLGLNKKYSQQLKELTMLSKLSIINKKSEFKPETELGERLWQLDILSTDLYNQMIYENTNIRLKREKANSVRTI